MKYTVKYDTQSRGWYIYKKGKDQDIRWAGPYDKDKAEEDCAKLNKGKIV